MLVTSIGQEEEYKNELRGILKSYDVTVDENTDIRRMETLLEQKRKK